MQWIYWYTPSEQTWSVGLINGQGLTIGIDSDWPTREQAERRAQLLAGGDRPCEAGRSAQLRERTP